MTTGRAELRERGALLSRASARMGVRVEEVARRVVAEHAPEKRRARAGRARGCGGWGKWSRNASACRAWLLKVTHRFPAPATARPSTQPTQPSSHFGSHDPVPSRPVGFFFFSCHPSSRPNMAPRCVAVKASEPQVNRACGRSPCVTLRAGKSRGALAPRAPLRCLLGPALFVFVASAPARLAFPLRCSGVHRRASFSRAPASCCHGHTV